jgi:tetratricopeptide (TPR) repeat protein
MGVLAIAAVSGALAYRAAARDRDYRLLIASGDAAASANETLAAIEDFSGAIAVRPDAMLARLKRGETYRRRGELEVAARDFRAAAALDPTATRPLEALGDVFVAQARFKRAADTYETRLRLDDRSAAVRYKLALARYRDADIDGALTEARRALALDDHMADAHYLAALCLRDKGLADNAVEELRLALARSPGLIPAREELADLLASTGHPAEELAELQVLAGLDSGRADRHVMIATAQAKAGKPELAILTLSSALEQSPDQPQLLAALGRIWLELADNPRDHADALPKALEALERAASSLTSTSEIKALYGRALAMSGQLEAAEQVFQQAVQRYPVDPAALLQLERVAGQLGHADVARTALTSYASLVQPDADAAAHAARIGALSLTLNDPSGALPWLQRAVATTPDDVSALAELADAQFRVGDMPNARTTLERGLALAPADKPLLALKRRLAGRTERERSAIDR